MKKTPKRTGGTGTPKESLTKIIPGNGVRPASQIRPESAVFCCDCYDEVYFNCLKKKKNNCRRLEKQLKWGSLGSFGEIGVSGCMAGTFSYSESLSSCTLG